MVTGNTSIVVVVVVVCMQLLPHLAGNAQDAFRDIAGLSRGKVIVGNAVMRGPTTNTHQCNELCRLTETCIAFSYNVTSRFCALFASSIQDGAVENTGIYVVHANVNKPSRGMGPRCKRQMCPSDTVCTGVGKSPLCVDQNNLGFYIYKSACEINVRYVWDTVCGFCYRLVTLLLNRQQASDTCLNDGGHLVKLDNMQKHLRLVELIQQHPVLRDAVWLWIGADDSQVEGEWRWADGSLVQFSVWAPGQPDASNPEEDYAVLLKTKSYEWNDRRPSLLTNAICEITL